MALVNTIGLIGWIVGWPLNEAGKWSYEFISTVYLKNPFLRCQYIAIKKASLVNHFRQKYKPYLRRTQNLLAPTNTLIRF